MCQVCDKELCSKSALNAHTSLYHNKVRVRRFKKVVDDIEEVMNGFSAEEKKATFKELVNMTEGLSAKEKKAAFMELVKRTEKI